MNVADTELVNGILQDGGFRQTTKINEADAIIINTCSVRDHAEAKIHSRLGNYHKIKQQRPEILIGLLGCMAQNLKDEILETKSYIDFVLGPDSYRRLPQILSNRRKVDNNIVDTKLSRFEVYDGLFPSCKEGINAWVSIMRGCDKFCTFCIVPFTRGRERSRNPQSLIEEIKRAIGNGFVEITLLGQNVNSFKYEDYNFTRLLEEISDIPGIKRLRFTSPHPNDVYDELLELIADKPNICNSIHVPLQAGSDRVLKRMNRTYTKKQFIQKVWDIRRIIPDVGLTTDIIVGFPGESHADFEETLAVMKTIKFDSAFTFKYSNRPYTKAAEYDAQVSENIKQKRLEKVITLQKKHTLLNNKKLIGKIVDVLVEKESKKSTDYWSGRTDNNKWVVFKKEFSKIKDIIPVRITGAFGVTLMGQIEED